ITSNGFLYRAPRAGGGVDRMTLPAPGVLLGAHNDVFVGWTDGNGNGTIADIDPPAGTVTALNQKPGALRGMVAGQHGYSFAVAPPDGTLVQTCLNADCTQPPDIQSEPKSLPPDLTTKTF